MSGERYPVVVWGDAEERWSLETLAERTGVHPERIQIYVEFGLLEPCEQAGSRLFFSSAAFTRLRCIERLRGDIGVNLAGVSVILDLVERVRRLQRELERRSGE